MVRFATILAICVTAQYLVSQVNGRYKGKIPEDRGVYNAALAYDSVCWWEFLKQIPTDSDAHKKCAGKGATSRNWVMTDPQFKDSPDGRVINFAHNLKDRGMSGQLPKDYDNQCTQFLEDTDAAPAADESDAMKDSNKNYPLKAFTYCLLHTLRERHGDEAVEDVKAERTHHHKKWKDSLLEQQNKLRARHGVGPLTENHQLSKAAQEWAEENAKECNPHHTTADARRWNGESTGENIFAIENYYLADPDDPENAAYSAADSWYEEIRDYPKQGYQGDNHDALFTKIGHFTQSTWKDSKQVGYGYAFNETCSQYNGNNVYVIARYYPVGNIPKAYVENVPPKQ